MASGDESKVTYPGNNYKITQCSNSFTSDYCVYMDFDTKASKTWKVTFSSTIHTGKTASYSLDFMAKCTPASTTISIVNAEGKNPLLKRKSTSTYTTMTMVQDIASPLKKIKLSEVLEFKSSSPSCPIVRYDLY